MSGPIPVITDIIYNSKNVANHTIPDPLDNPAPTELSYGAYNRPTVEGTATPGSTVYLYFNATLEGQFVADANWHWSAQIPDKLTSGVYDIQAIQDPVFTSSGDMISFGSASNNAGLTVTSQLPPVITDIVGNTGSTQLSIPEGSRTDTTNLTLIGTAEPGSIIEIFDNGQKIGEATTSKSFSEWYTPNGWAWQFTPTTALDPNTTHTFTVSSKSAMQDYLGYSIQTTPANYPYTIGIGVTPAPPALLAPVITSVVDDVGVNQGAVADGGQTNDVRPTLHGTSEPGTVVTVSDNGHVIGTATTGADWQWTFTPGADLTAGTNTLSVTAARPDNAGSSTAAWYTHVLDVTPSLDAVLATAGLSAAPAAAPAPTVQAAYVSEATHPAAVLPVHDLAY